jgi:hypothetical protein
MPKSKPKSKLTLRPLLEISREQQCADDGGTTVQGLRLPEHLHID